MPTLKTTVLSLAVIMSPLAVLAQAAINSDQPLSRSNDGGAAIGQGTGLDAPSSRDVPNALTGPGSPGTTGTGPTGTMAAPGR